MALTPYAFLLPALLVTAAVIFFPVLQTLWMSLHNYVLFRPRNVPFIGLTNFARAMADEVFWISLKNSLFWIGLVVSLQFLLGLCAALLLNQSFWWRGIARSLIIIPWALPSVIIGLMWSWMYDFHIGVVNDLLDPPRRHRRSRRVAGTARHGALFDHRCVDLAGLSVLHRGHSGGPADDSG